MRYLKKVFFIFLSYYILNVNSLYADFFDVCNIPKDDRKKIDYVIKNGNSKFIPRDIDEIDNETFKQALYLLSFYKDGSAFQEDMIDIIGLDVIKQVQRFKYYTINYILKKYKNNEIKIKQELKGLINSNKDIVYILQNKYVQYNDKNKGLNKMLKIAFFDEMLDIETINFLIKKYNKNITDKMILQQIRFRLYNKKTENVQNLISKIKSNEIKNKALKINKFYKDINKKTEITIKLKNGKTKKRYKNLSKEQIIKLCNQNIGVDEYIDLICISNDSKNIKYLETILQNNLNSVFMPSKWLEHRIYYVRDKINHLKDEEITEEDYDVIANSGRLDSNKFYTQQFLAGLTAYLRKDYENAILHFSKCAKNSKFSDYNSKAYYWLGLSYKYNNKPEDAKYAFQNAKNHIFTMYGQLASSELFEDPEKNIEQYIKSFKENPKILCNDVNFILGYLDQYKKINNKLSEILNNYINNENTDKEKIFNALCVIKNDFHSQYSSALSVYSIKYDVIHQEISFPTSNFEDDSLINAVIKKESNFKPTAISNKGARGIMQIMPSTGKILAKNMGIDFDYKKLMQDEEYNINMGKFYIENLLTRYDDNKLLALASYNAGASNVEKWIKNNGDPRNMSSYNEIVEWIEKIPFLQTREYVVKILGFEMVYDVIREMNNKS